MSKTYNYNQQMNIKYAHQELIDVPAIVAENTEKWFNQSLTAINGSVARLGIVEGEYHWHKHDNDDEFFFVLEGKLLIDLEDRTVELKAGQGFVVPRTVVHRTRALERAVVLMVENVGIIPTGN